MLKFHARDNINDIAIIETSFCFWVRYGLEQTKCDTIDQAMEAYKNALRHALNL